VQIYLADIGNCYNKEGWRPSAETAHAQAHTHTHTHTLAVLLVKESRINATLELWILSELCGSQNFCLRGSPGFLIFPY